MNLRTFTVFLWGFLIASAAVAGEQHETHVKILTDDADGVFEWHSTDPNADFSDLEVGESKTITGDNGEALTVTRTDEGLEFGVDGKKIQLMEFVDDDEVVVEKSKRVKIIRTEDAADVTIISSDAIDEKTRARIEAALKDAGKDGEILFIDGSELGSDAQAHGPHDVRIISKKIEKTN